MKQNYLKRTAAFGVIFAAMAVLGASTVYGQDKQASKLADKVATAFSLGLKDLDAGHLLNGRLRLTIENTGGDVEFEYKSFSSFGAMERWMKRQENDDGFPMRETGSEKISCRKGVCEMDLVDNQMRHSHVFLTKMYYGYSKGRIYVKRLYIVYG